MKEGRGKWIRVKRDTETSFYPIKQRILKGIRLKPSDIGITQLTIQGARECKR